MAIFNKPNNLTKEDLKTAGLDVDDLNTKLGGIPTEDKIKTIIASSVADTVKNSLSELETRLTESLKTRVNSNNNRDGGDNNNNNNENENVEIDPMTFMEDPVAHTKKIIQESTRDVHLSNINLAANIAYREAKNTLPYFKISAIEEEIQKEWEKYPINFKVNPDVLIKNIYDMVVGRHTDEIMVDTAKKEGKFNLVQPGGTSRLPNTQPSSKKDGSELTTDELKAAKNFGMTPEEYSTFKGSENVKYV